MHDYNDLQEEQDFIVLRWKMAAHSGPRRRAGNVRMATWPSGDRQVKAKAKTKAKRQARAAKYSQE